MTKLEKEEILDHEISELIIPSQKVAIVQEGNTLEHALLVLIKSGYSAIPVLDRDYKLKGLVSTTLILDSILGLEKIEYDNLSAHKVEEVMDTKVARIMENGIFFKALELSINHPFLCVVNEEGVFTGILTRKSILAIIHRHLKH
ncbi:CBS domain-containing protein [Aneurinibacillus sp. Ricciae_BoGa-3]|uniref:cyclic-di-AMP-binding protein CbpB n=1 Tax=Aneurinibacillus sp. Ricciae_BoGa-3 TaxID=3022697 RepID=UPI0023404D08|nr:cyclic-di-AMP-binding protein CbpB [Aneurinibacillus sp. Ricciae_BoGa-3]WCK52797.1 CBS domain-containing protein [Aneurinibacillus sp. Ricciae_BoGa-3]